MGTRPDLDLSDILPAYQTFITGHGTSTAGVNRIHATPEGDKWMPMEVGDEGRIPHHLFGESTRRDPLKPWRIGNGPPVCSTSQVLVSARPSFAWDVNGWYAKVGVPFPYVNATSGVLSRSYVATGGQASPQATYYLKRLLDKAVRGLYDTYPLGVQFLDDDYVQEALKRKAAEEAARRSRDGSYTKAETVMDEWGYKVDEIVEDGLDTDKPDVLNDLAPVEDSRFDPIEWVYSYWLWQTTLSMEPSTQELEEWQRLLVSVLAQRGERVEIAVGRSGKSPHPYTVGRFDGYWVVFLHEDEEPTKDLATRAADALLEQISTRQDT